MNKTSSPVAEAIEAIPQRIERDVVTLNDFKDIMHERSFCLLLLIFALPIAAPVPYPPGFTAILGLPMVVLAYQMMMGWDTPWLPKWVGRKTLRRATLARFIEKSAPYLRHYERLSKQRLAIFSTQRAERLVGMIAFLCAISIMLPIPFGNAIPSSGILCMMLGLLTRDGVIIFLGMCISIFGLVISAGVVAGSATVALHLMPKLQVFLGLA